MSFVLATLAQVSMPAGSPPSIVLAPPGEAEITTSMLVGRYHCAGTNSEGRPFSFVLVDGGGRLFTDPNTGKPALTREEIHIENGEGAAFDEYAFYKRPGHYRGETSAENAPLGSAIEIELFNVDPPTGPHPGGDRFAFVQSGFWEWMSLANAVGFCDLSVSEQPPLTPQETSEYLSQ
jgi:hypothetical protein